MTVSQASITGDAAASTRVVAPVRRNGFWPIVNQALPPVLMTAALLTPLLVLTLHGLSTVGFTEESTGYRYFYSLRYLYTPDERPWIPQGQTMTLVHMLLQLLLTALGFPITQLYPRIELFAWIGTALPHLATGAALFWALRPVRSLAVRIAVPAAITFVALQGTFNWDRHVLLPDYYSWIHTLAVISIGCCLRLTAPDWRPSRRWEIGLGLFVGASLGLKVTLLMLVAPPVLLWMRRHAIWRMVTGLVVMGVVAVVSFSAIVFVAHAGSMSAVLQLFAELVKFQAAAGGQQTASFLDRYMPALAQGENAVVRYLHLVPVALLLGLIFMRHRMISAAMLVGAIVPVLLLTVRFTASTLVETGDSLVVSATVWSIRVLAPALDSALRRISGKMAEVPPLWAERVRTGAPVVVCAILVMGTVFSLNRMTSYYLHAVSSANAIEARLTAFTSDPPGRVAIITLDNNHHPYTVDSAIFKGGTNISQSLLWGSSPLVSSIVPDRGYFAIDSELHPPIDVSSYRYLLFVSRQPPELFSAMQARLEKELGLSLQGFECPIALPNAESAGIQYGCQRKPDAPVAEHRGDIAYAPSVLTAFHDAAAFKSDGIRASLQVGEAVYGGSTGEIWRLEEDQTFTRLTGEPGETVLIRSLGEWSERQQQLVGIEATFNGTRWQLADERPEAVNRNPRFDLRSDGSVRGWEIIGGSSVSLTRAPFGPITDGQIVPDRVPLEDDVLKIRASTPLDRLGVRTSVGLDDRAGAPMGAEVSVRRLGAGELQVQFHSLDKSARPGPEATAQVIKEANGWQTIRLVLEPDQITGTRVELVVESLKPQPGSAVDFQRAEIFAGRAPW